MPNVRVDYFCYPTPSWSDAQASDWLTLGDPSKVIRVFRKYKINLVARRGLSSLQQNNRVD